MHIDGGRKLAFYEEIFEPTMNQETLHRAAFRYQFGKSVEHALIYLGAFGLGLGQGLVPQVLLLLALVFRLIVDRDSRKLDSHHLPCLFRVNRLDDVICDTCYKAICCMGRRSGWRFRLGDL